jgi:hypothetical protein
MVDSVEAVVAHGGVIVQPIGADAPEVTARFLDPGGRVRPPPGASGAGCLIVTPEATAPPLRCGAVSSSGLSVK